MDTFIIFSRDRPLQLHCTLRTLLEQGNGLAGVPIQVILRATDDVYLRQYREVFRELSGLRDDCRLLFVEEESFADELAACLFEPEVHSGFFSRFQRPGGDPARPLPRTSNRLEHVLLGVDDCIFVAPFEFPAVSRLLAERPEILGCSLRLGRNTTQNYMASTTQRVPPFVPIDGGLVSFDWTTAEG
ncbi:MAG: hypothetical protein NZ658_06940, partial [Pirellulales bacterium]|nr:hypothetical protein [Pirellulales bacterium]